MWFPRQEAPAFYDRLMHECFRGGLKSPWKEGLNELTILSLVSHGMGVGWVNRTAHWRKNECDWFCQVIPSQECDQCVHGLLWTLFHEPMPGIFQIERGDGGRHELHLRA